jgi:hypothetical protein
VGLFEVRGVPIKLLEHLMGSIKLLEDLMGTTTDITLVDSGEGTL